MKATVCAIITHPRVGTIGLRDVIITTHKISGIEISTKRKPAQRYEFPTTCIKDIWVRKYDE